ncbi:hypothetical protein Tco_0951990 [Tanacetum coccineum]|uniref:Uncharacterized protein n=1 Tax=Tanacetum coccineum TaxID=301880 RepID=A0ABQ5DVT8_9ASTR
MISVLDHEKVNGLDRDNISCNNGNGLDEPNDEQNNKEMKRTDGWENKREQNSVRSGGKRSKKKRKANNEDDFVRTNKVLMFSSGAGNISKSNGKRVVDRRSATKALEVTRRAGMDGSGETKKGILDV